MTKRLPALFLGHGSPMTLVTRNPEVEKVAAIGAALPPIRAVLCISAHYESRGRTHLTIGDAPRTIHDFRGFPDELYKVTYPAPGADWLVERVAVLIGEERCARDAAWGFDHGVYGVLLPLFGGATVPTVAMSLDRSLTPHRHLELGRALAPLRDEGVLVVGSGNIVHNLALYRQTAGTRPDWAVAFQGRINAALLTGDDAGLVDLAAGGEAAALAVNSGEHYLPLLYAAGARLPGDTVSLFNDSIDGALSMTSACLAPSASLTPAPG